MRDANCIFCRIVEGDLPANKLYEDDKVVAFWDAHPSAPIHVLIVPKNHIPTLNDLPQDNDLLQHIGNVAIRIAKEIGVADRGYRFLINVNREGGQVIFHLHAHIMAGKDFGISLIRFAVVVSVLWRKLAGLFRRRKV